MKTFQLTVDSPLEYVLKMFHYRNFMFQTQKKYTHILNWIYVVKTRKVFVLLACYLDINFSPKS